MIDRDVHTAVVNWLASRTGIPFIKNHQEGDPLPQPYGLANLTGQDEIRDHASRVIHGSVDDDTGFVQTIAENEWRFSLHVYGNDPSNFFRPVRMAVHASILDEPLMPGLLVHEVSQIRIVPEWINEGWEPRAQMDLIIRGTLRDTYSGTDIYVVEEHTPAEITRID